MFLGETKNTRTHGEAALLRRTAVTVYTKGEQQTKKMLVWCNLHDWFEERRWRRILLRAFIVIVALELAIGITGTVALYWLLKQFALWVVAIL